MCIIYCYSDYRSHFLSNSQLVSFSVCTMSSLRFFATRILLPFYYHDSKLLNSSDRVERQVKSSRYPLQSEFRSSAGSPSLRPNIFIRGHFRSPTIYSGLQFSCKKYVTVYHSWSPVNRASLVHVIRHVQTFSWRHWQKSEKNRYSKRFS